MRRNDVASTSFRRRVPIRFLINQCQIITFLILKYDIIEKSRIELRGIVLPIQMGGLLGGGGGAKGMLAPPLKLLGGGPGPPPCPPSSYAYVHVFSFLALILVDSSIVICWSSPFVILGVSSQFCLFYSIFLMENPVSKRCRP